MISRFSRSIIVSMSALVLAASALFAAESAPMENTVRGDGPPPFESAQKGAALILGAIKAGDPQLAADFFFPAKAFDLLKALAAPGRYHKKLVAWYREDIIAEHPRFKDPSWTFEKIEPGRCKWQEKGTEGNALPYWSCRGNRVVAKSGERTRAFEIRVMINWGRTWYVTHLGRIRP